MDFPDELKLKYHDSLWRILLIFFEIELCLHKNNKIYYFLRMFI